MSYKVAGVEPSKPDLRDIHYASPFLPEELPSKVDLREHVFEVEQQGSIGSCVANAIVSSCEMLAKRNSEPIDLSRLFLYNATKAYSGRLGEEGLHAKNAYHVAYKYGMPTEDSYPYDVSKDDIDPPSAMYREALENRIDRYETVANWVFFDTEKKIHNIKSALAEGLPVGISLVVKEGIYEMEGPLDQHRYLYNEAVVGGHFMLVVGYDDAAGKFIVQNSWGEGWGDGGYGGFDYSLVDEPFFQGFVARSFKGYEIRREPGCYVEKRFRYKLTVQIVPPEHMIGEKVDIYMGATQGDGKWFIRDTVSDIDGDSTLAGDRWSELESSGLVPCWEDYELSPLRMGDNHINVISWMDTEPLKGTKIHVAYGKTVDNLIISEAIVL